MPKRNSELSKILKFFMTADEASARASLDAASTIVDQRFAPAAPAEGRKKPGRKPGRKPRQPGLPVESGNSDQA